MLHGKVEGLSTPGPTTLINTPRVNYPRQNTTHVNLKDKFVSSSERCIMLFFFLNIASSHWLTICCRLISTDLFFVTIKDETRILT
jgi:hypothetical protein